MRANRLGTVELCLLLMITSCTKHAPLTASRIPVPASPPASIAALNEADRAFAAKEYDDACRGYEDYVRLTPAKDQEDQALFRLGIAYTLRKSGADWQRAQVVWKRLV